jgi:hypothetical protein
MLPFQPLLLELVAISLSGLVYVLFHGADDQLHPVVQRELRYGSVDECEDFIFLSRPEKWGAGTMDEREDLPSSFRDLSLTSHGESAIRSIYAIRGPSL